MRLGAYTVEIVAGDSETPLDEYQVELKGNEITCWVASEEGKTFKVNIVQRTGWTRCDTSARLFLDGSPTQIASRLFSSTKVLNPIPGRSISNSEVAPFLFKSIVTTDEDTLESSNVTDAFGSIKLHIHRGSKGKAKAGNAHEDPSTTSAYNELAVKKRKLTHVCGFAEPVPKEVFNREFTYIDALDAPLFVFIFKYRSRSLLQAMDIIQASPAPPSPPQNAVAGPSRHSGTLDIIEVSSGEDSDDEAVRALTVALAKAKNDARAAKAARRVSKIESEDVKPKLERGDDGSVPRHAKKAKVEDEVIELSD